MTDPNDDELRASEEVDESVEIFDGTPDFDLSPTATTDDQEVTG